MLETETSNNVYRELKHALKNKSIEHKVREAKVLGIEVDVKKLEEDYITTVIEKKDNNDEMKRSFVVSNKSENHNEISNFAFNLDIAMKATEKMRLLFDVSEETFECDSDESIGDEQAIPS